jgi:hypothetical protein
MQDGKPCRPAIGCAVNSPAPITVTKMRRAARPEQGAKKDRIIKLTKGI